MQYRRKTGLAKKIEELRQRSSTERKRAAFLTAFALTFVVASVWATVIFPRTLRLEEGNLALGREVAAPLEQLREDSAHIIKDLREGIAEIRDLSATLFSRTQTSAEAETTSEGGESSAVGESLPPPNDATFEEEQGTELEPYHQAENEAESTPKEGSEALQMGENMVE